MKVLDRYLLRELLLPIFYSCLMLIFLILIADLFDNLDVLLRNKTPPAIILRYYFALIPYAYSQTIAWAAWLGTLFLLVNIGFHNELIAMKAAGIKIVTIIRPIVFMGFLIGIFTFLVNDRLVPRSFRTAHDLRQIHIEKKRFEHDKLLRNVTYYSGGEQLHFFRTFSLSAGKVTGAVSLWLGDGPASTGRQKMVAEEGLWIDSGWKFLNVTEYQMDARGRILGDPRAYPEKIYPDIRFTPAELAAASTEKAFLTYKELKHTIQRLKENAVSAQSESVDLHTRLASPWQALVMMLIAIPILSKTLSRKVIAYQVLFCIGVIFAYHVLGAVGLALGKAGKIFPFLSAWLANILFGSWALFYLEKGNH